MGTNTKISWCDATWNPVRGCTRVSSGCQNCYAERVAARFSGPGQPYEGLAKMTPSGPRWTGELRMVADHLEDPLRWQKPRRVFVNSMSDLFHKSIPDEWIDKIFAAMALSQRHVFQVLTKRPERMREYLADNEACLLGTGVPESVDSAMEPLLDAHLGKFPKEFQEKWYWERPQYGEFGRVELRGYYGSHEKIFDWPLPNVHLGTSCEDQATADERILHLLRCPAAVRWLSLEPLLGPIDIERFLYEDPRMGAVMTGAGGKIDWVVVGAESGPSARPMDLDWVRSLRDQCVSAGVPFFFKQMIVDGRKVELPELDGRVWAEYP